jgi:hypothetical protein
MSENNQITLRQEPSLFNIATLSEANDFSLQMSKAKLIPAHLQQSPSDCLRVVMQAAKWGMDPFAVADKTSVISGKLMYEGQLVAAVINTRANLSKRLSYTFSGTGAQRLLVVAGTIRGESEALTIDLTYSQACAINKNGQMQKNPDQQMCYIGARIWARRHMPELMLGVTAADEIPDDVTVMENVTGTAEVVPEPVPQRQAPPPRAKKGAAAVVENADKPKAEPVIEAVATVVEPTPAPTPAPVAKQPEPVATPIAAKYEEAKKAATIEPAAKAEPAAAKVPRTTLNDGEEITAVCTVLASKGMVLITNKIPAAGACVEIDGEFKGTIYHNVGGVSDRDINEKDVNVVPIKAWTPGNRVAVKLLGKFAKGLGKVLVRVVDVSEAPADDSAVDLG